MEYCLTHETRVITPDEAMKMLEKNQLNRKLSTRLVTKYSQAMRDGEWLFDGSPIRLDDKGNLLDGQHRLWAVIESELPQTFLVVEGVEEITMAVMDTGKSRSFADILSMHYRDLTSVTHTSSTVTAIHRWESGARGVALKPGRGNMGSTQTLLKFFDENKDGLLEAQMMGRRVRENVGGTGQPLALLAWITFGIDADDAQFFFDRIIDGVGLEAGSPILAFRNWIIRTNSQLPRVEFELFVALGIKAWNAYRSGSEVQMLVWKRGGSKPEPFPTPS